MQKVEVEVENLKNLDFFFNSSRAVLFSESQKIFINHH